MRVAAALRNGHAVETFSDDSAPEDTRSVP